MIDRAVAQVLSPSGLMLLALGIAIWLLALLPPRWRRVWGMGWLGGAVITLIWTLVEMDESGWAYIKPVIYTTWPLLMFDKGLYGPKAIFPRYANKPNNE